MKHLSLNCSCNCSNITMLACIFSSNNRWSAGASSRDCKSVCQALSGCSRWAPTVDGKPRFFTLDARPVFGPEMIKAVKSNRSWNINITSSHLVVVSIFNILEKCRLNICKSSAHIDQLVDWLKTKSKCNFVRFYHHSQE